MQIEVGDLIIINNREAVPCDVLIVGVDEPAPQTPAGIAYVETKSLDGETNLKIRQVRWRLCHTASTVGFEGVIKYLAWSFVALISYTIIRRSVPHASGANQPQTTVVKPD